MMNLNMFLFLYAVQMITYQICVFISRLYMDRRIILKKGGLLGEGGLQFWKQNII